MLLVRGLVALATLLAPCRTAASLTPRADKSSLPAPITVAPDQDWEGIDGKWNTFSLRVGTPYQPVHVFVSTASQQTWVVNKLACLYNETDQATNTTFETQDTDCYNGRGWTFNSSDSTSWDYNGFYQLWIEKNLELAGNGRYGWDTVGLGLPGEEGPTLLNTTVGTIITSDFWLGHFGVNPKPTNFTNFTDPSPSYMSLLFDQKHIPSVSFGYTAGAQYRTSMHELARDSANRFRWLRRAWKSYARWIRRVALGGERPDLDLCAGQREGPGCRNREHYSIHVDQVGHEAPQPGSVFHVH